MHVVLIARGAQNVPRNRAAEQVAAGPSRDHHAHSDAQARTTKNIGDDGGHGREEGAVGGAVQNHKDDEGRDGRAEGPDQQHADGVEHERRDQRVERAEHVRERAAAQAPEERRELEGGDEARAAERRDPERLGVQRDEEDGDEEGERGDEAAEEERRKAEILKEVPIGCDTYIVSLNS